jgi:hypothetical protein
MIVGKDLIDTRMDAPWMGALLGHDWMPHAGVLAVAETANMNKMLLDLVGPINTPALAAGLLPPKCFDAIDWSAVSGVSSMADELTSISRWPVAGFVGSILKDLPSMPELLFGNTDVLANLALVGITADLINRADLFSAALGPAQSVIESLVEACKLPSWFDSEFFRDLVSDTSIHAYRPDNWDETVDDESAQALICAGWPLMWAPRSNIVQQLIDADDDEARKAIVLAHADEILSDCAEALDMIDQEDLLFHRGMTTEAITAARSNLLKAAQSTAIVAIDAACLMHWKIKVGPQLKQTVQSVGDIKLRDVLRALCLAAVAVAFTTFRVTKGDSVPVELNRHASIHAASEVQYTDVNALLAIMMAVSVLRTINHDMKLLKRRQARSAA